MRVMKLMLVCMIISVMRYDFNIDEEECIVKETPLKELCAMPVHEVSASCPMSFEYKSQNLLDWISTSLICLSPTPSLSMSF